MSKITTFTLYDCEEGPYQVVHSDKADPIKAARKFAINEFGEQWIEEFLEGGDDIEDEDAFLKEAAEDWVKIVSTVSK
jgi:hypothetical protein